MPQSKAHGILVHVLVLFAVNSVKLHLIGLKIEKTANTLNYTVPYRIHQLIGEKSIEQIEGHF